MDTNIKAMIYARQSTNKQEHSLDNQTRACEEYCRRNGWEIAGVYKEIASGGKRDRKIRQQLLTDCAAKGITKIVISALDRWSRSLQDVLQTLEYAKNLGVAIHPTNGDLDNNSPTGRFIIIIQGGMAQWDREMIVSRVNDGLARARERGSRFGRPQNPQWQNKALHAAILAGEEKNYIRRTFGLSQSTYYKIRSFLKTTNV